MLTISACTYGHTPGQFLSFVGSLLSQTDQNFICQIWHDGPSHDKDRFNEFKDILEDINEEYGNKFIWYSTKQRYNDYGHTLREMGLKEADTEFFHWTNLDNTYMPRFVELMMKQVTEEVDLVVCNAVHNYAFGEYGLLKGYPMTNYIDFCNFIVRTDLAKAHGFPYRDFAADGQFIDAIMPKVRKWAKIEAILSVHN